MTFYLNIIGDMFWILVAIEFHIFGPARLTVYLIMIVLYLGFVIAILSLTWVISFIHWPLSTAASIFSWC